MSRPTHVLKYSDLDATFRSINRQWHCFSSTFAARRCFGIYFRAMKLVQYELSLSIRDDTLIYGSTFSGKRDRIFFSKFEWGKGGLRRASWRPQVSGERAKATTIQLLPAIRTGTEVVVSYYPRFKFNQRSCKNKRSLFLRQMRPKNGSFEENRGNK